MEEQNKVTLNGKEYDFLELEDNEQYFVNQLRDLKSRIVQAKFNLDQLVMAENAFTSALITSVESEKETDEG
tara:strand:+ start:242 stop:457 length:216 start_codon:yes stop_codon:yes gene_type:complete